MQDERTGLLERPLQEGGRAELVTGLRVGKLFQIDGETGGQAVVRQILLPVLGVSPSIGLSDPLLLRLVAFRIHGRIGQLPLFRLHPSGHHTHQGG